MKYMKKLIYKLAKPVTMLAIAGASLFAACSKDDDDHGSDYEIHFNTLHSSSLDSLNVDTIRRVLANPNVKKLYLVPTHEWGRAPTQGIHNMRVLWLEPAINVDPKRVSGRGDFDFTPGVIDQTDSLWYVQHGWTINKKQK